MLLRAQYVLCEVLQKGQWECRIPDCKGFLHGLGVVVAGVEGGEFGGSEWEINIHTLGIKYTSGFNNAMKKNRVETVNSNWKEKAEEPLAVFKKEVKQMFSMAVMFWPNLKDVKGGHWKCPGEEGFRRR